MKKSEAPEIRIYGDVTSQPTRALLSFCKAAHIPYQFKRTLIARGDHFTEQFAKISPFQQVPTIQDLRNGFTLFESQSIMRYLCRTFPVSSHFYPEHDARQVALVDQYLDSHLDGIRKSMYLIGVESYFSLRYSKSVMKQLRKKQSIEFLWSRLKAILDTVEHTWLGDQERNKQAKVKNQFNWLVGVGKEPTIADFSAFAQLYQFNFVPHWLKQIFQERPHLARWFKKMHGIPAVKEVSDQVDVLILRLKKVMKKRPKI